MRVAASLEAMALTSRTTSSPRRLNSRWNCVTNAVVRSSSTRSKARRVTEETIAVTAATDRKTVSENTASSLR